MKKERKKKQRKSTTSSLGKGNIPTCVCVRVYVCVRVCHTRCGKAIFVAQRVIKKEEKWKGERERDREKTKKNQPSTAPSVCCFSVPFNSKFRFQL